MHYKALYPIRTAVRTSTATFQRNISTKKSHNSKLWDYLQDAHSFHFHFFFYLGCEAIGIAATPGLLCHPRVKVKMIVEKQGTQKFSEKTCPSATFVHHKIPHDQTRLWTRAAAVESRRLTAWAMARPPFSLTVPSLQRGPTTGQLRKCLACHQTLSRQRWSSFWYSGLWHHVVW
jgi:hypothetical protein